MPNTDRMTATAFAEGFVKECKARGLSREQAESAWTKAAQNYAYGMGQPNPDQGTPNFWSTVGHAGDAYYGGVDMLGSGARKVDKFWSGGQDGDGIFSGAWAGIKQPFRNFYGKTKHVFGGGAPEDYVPLGQHAAPTENELSAARRAAGKPEPGSVTDSNDFMMTGGRFGRFGYDPYSRPAMEGGEMVNRPYVRSGALSGMFG